MLLLHLTPLNADNVPWRIEYVELEDNAQQLSRVQVMAIKPNTGEYPSPLYAAGSSFDTGDALIFGTIPTEEAAIRIQNLCSRHSELIFTNERSLSLFKALALRLLINDPTAGHNICTLRNLCEAARLFKNMWLGVPADLRSTAWAIIDARKAGTASKSNVNTNSNPGKTASLSVNSTGDNFTANVNVSNAPEPTTLANAQAKELNKASGTDEHPNAIIDCAAIIITELRNKFPQLIAYYLAPALPFKESTLLPHANPSLWLAVREQEMRLIVPLKVSAKRIYCMDLAHAPLENRDGAFIINNNHTWIFSPAGLITNEILTRLELNASVCEERLASIKSIISQPEILADYLDQALSRNPEETALTAPLTDSRALGLRANQRLSHHTYQTISGLHGDIDALCTMLPKLRGFYRLMVMDYLAGASPEYLREPYRSTWLEAARSRELYGRETFTKELEELTRRNLPPRIQNIVKRLCSAVERLMNGG